jgi:hypothetical protein
MIAEAKQRYRGVLCIHCRQPIPLPVMVSCLEYDFEDEDTSKPQKAGRSVLALRCRACQEEGLYTESKFIDCEGTPRARSSRDRKASPLPKEPWEPSRAAAVLTNIISCPAMKACMEGFR